ncbi:hypothetical protein HIM_12416 [Hirsutella minnesotensis 3608]|uniref:Amino acid transporter transmembrane domain-containing protein n=1 Tax=Hirsutella minnesotensis 3608 TaxID=1043627 RepID=A0A0F7ZEY3_9HYPO|nr:hypothetical protein HIM_12416 [Hirsutella minnesotensis 3608]
MASVERRWSPDGFSPGSSTLSNLKRKSKKTFFFGGTDFIIGPRIVPLPERLKNDEIYQGDDSGAAILEKQLASEEGQEIQYRTCSWQKIAALLFSQFIALPAMSFPFAYSQLGLGLGLAVTAVVAVISFYTSLIIWEFCLRHPEARDVCDIGQMIFGGKEWMWWVIVVVYVLNNIFSQGFSVLSGAQYLNTMTENDIIGGCRTVEFAITITIACWLASLPRTFSLVSKLGTISALFTFAKASLFY